LLIIYNPLWTPSEHRLQTLCLARKASDKSSSGDARSDEVVAQLLAEIGALRETLARCQGVTVEQVQYRGLLHLMVKVDSGL